MTKPKYVILVGDGMGDYPVASLGGRTPLEVAHTPFMSHVARMGEIGTVQTIPLGMEPGSDIANMALLGYDPAVYHTGRAPLEAASLGVSLGPTDTAFRCNLVNLEQDTDGTERMGDYSAGHISTAEAHELIRALQSACEGLPLRLYPGVSYRHLVVWEGGPTALETTPPHDIIGQATESYAAVYEKMDILRTFMTRCRHILADHPVNRRRREAGLREANAVWLWGQGRAPSMPTLQDLFGIRGVMISAVDLLKGLGIYAGLTPLHVPGATGYLDTNYAGKVSAALEALQDMDLAFVHVEAPDEAGHEGSLTKKVQAIEDFDGKVVGPMLDGLARYGRCHVLIAADHLTPLSVRTHVVDPSLFALFKGNVQDPVPEGRDMVFCEAAARESGLHLDSGTDLFRRFMGGPSQI